ncbi:MAG: RsmE family RNA methyltransferase, partial [Gaiellales bacterium]
AVLSERDRHHLGAVLRMQVGDTCEVAAGGRVWTARVTAGGLELVEEIAVVTQVPTLTVWIAQPGGRSADAVEKLTELGVSRIGALRSELLKGEFSDARIERWQRVAEAAAKQSKQTRIPDVIGVSDFADVLSPEAVVLSHTGASGGLADRIVGRRSATLLIGPEPGFSEQELELARGRGVAVATFGPVVLRTETAAVVAAALALREMGFLG